MAKVCVFCGKRPESKTKEHVIPRWLIEMTGDPKRGVSFGTYTLQEHQPAPKALAFDQLTFPACDGCNGDYSQLESRAKVVMERVLQRATLTNIDFDVLFDWFDKVRTGMWLGLQSLAQNPWGIEPKFYIAQRIGLHDRSLGVCLIENRHPGINLVGPESPCFGLSPTTMCLFVNNVGFFNASTLGLCSRRLGFPFPTDLSLRHDGMMEAGIALGLERILRPIEPAGPLSNQPFFYQPILERGLDNAAATAYETEYVRRNALDFSSGRGAIFLERNGTVHKYGDDPSVAWIPESSLSLRQVYLAGRRWAYAQLERHYRNQSKPRDPLQRLFTRVHERLLTMYEKHMK